MMLVRNSREFEYDLCDVRSKDPTETGFLHRNSQVRILTATKLL